MSRNPRPGSNTAYLFKINLIHEPFSAAHVTIRTNGFAGGLHRNKTDRRQRMSPNHIHGPVVPVDDFRVAVIKNNVEGVKGFLKQGKL